MPAKDPRIDDYIAKSADFAKPILNHLRKLVHTACPDVEETLKWGFPHFLHQGMLCSMAAFKHHCSFGFWKSALILKKEARLHEHDAMGQFGQITSLADLPADQEILGYIKEAARLNEAGIKLPPKSRPKAPKELVVPADFLSALKRNKKAHTTFDRFTYSHKKEYVEWITEAKRPETRNQRLATAIAWMAEGKARHWKYQNC